MAAKNMHVQAAAMLIQSFVHKCKHGLLAGPQSLPCNCRMQIRSFRVHSAISWDRNKSL